MPIIEDAKLVKESCQECSEGQLKLLQGKKDPSKYYLACNTCKKIGEAEQKAGKWGFKPETVRRETGIICRFCGCNLIEILKNSRAFCVCPNSKRGDADDIHQDFIIFCLEKNIISKCELCEKGYQYRDVTKKGAKVKRCSYCNAFEFTEKKEKKGGGGR